MGTVPLLSWEGPLTRPDWRGDLPHGVPAALVPARPLHLIWDRPGTAWGAGSWAEGCGLELPGKCKLYRGPLGPWGDPTPGSASPPRAVGAAVTGDNLG